MTSASMHSLSFFDKCVGFLNTQEGSQALFNAISCSSQYAQKLPFSGARVEALGKIAEGFGSAADALSMVELARNVNELRESFHEHGESEPSEHKGFFSRSIRQIGYNLLEVGKSFAETAKFILQAVGKTRLVGFTLLGAGAGVFKGMIDLKNHAYALLHREEEVAGAQDEGKSATSSVNLTLLKLAQTVSFLALDAFTLAGLAIASFDFAGAILASLSCGVVMQVAVHFFSRE